ncbi:unnamed protein product [Amoebophrya sp. A120]|nr:unnamed protein product [Amoebophrya sp. A120]|eukprot:GSA120T00025659001.1
MGGFSRRNRKQSQQAGGEVSMTLSLLQDRIKRDSLAYKQEFQAQVQHFESVLELLLLNPQKPSKQFDEQVMFLAHVCPYYEYKDFPQKIIKLLKEKSNLLHAQTRKVLVQALILLRNRNQYELIDALPLHFQLLALDDKNVRSMVHTHIVRDVLRMNEKSQNMIENKKLQGFFFAQLDHGNNKTQNGMKNVSNTGNNNNLQSSNSSTVSVGDANYTASSSGSPNTIVAARKALIILISLYKKNIWTTASVVNAIAQAVLHNDMHVAKAAANFLLGNTHLVAEEDGEDSEDENKKEIGNVSKKVLGIKRFAKSGQKKKKMEKAKKKALKSMSGSKKAKSGLENKQNFAAIDLLHDPQKLAEQLLVRIMRGNENYAFRLLLLQLTSRLMGRHKLIIPNFYPYLQKYLSPTQREVTTVLACLAQSCHTELACEVVRPAVAHVFSTFVNETNAPEVITVGINSLREIACRVPHALTEEEVHDLCGFRKYKHKGVRVGVKSLVNMYRELNPAFLQKQFRGKEAAEALARGELKNNGEVTAETLFGQGMELLAARKLRKEEKKREKEENTGADSGSEENDSDAAEVDSDAEQSIEDWLDEEEEDSQSGTEGDDENDSTENIKPTTKNSPPGGKNNSTVDVKKTVKKAGASKASTSDVDDACKSNSKKQERRSKSSSKKESEKDAELSNSEEESGFEDLEEEDFSDLEEEISDFDEVPSGSEAEDEDLAQDGANSDSANDTKNDDSTTSRKRPTKELSNATRKKRKLAEKREEKRQMDEKKQKIEAAAKNIMMDQILGPEDFKKMRKLQAQKAMQMQTGRGRKKNADPYEFSTDTSSDSDNEKDNSDKENDSDDEDGSDNDIESSSDENLDPAEKAKREKQKQSKKVYNDLDFLDPSKLTGFTRKKHDKHTRLQSVKKGREGREKFGQKKQTRTGGSTNKEKRRNKPMLMQIQSRQVRTKKNGQKATAKLANLRKHIGNLKKGGKHQKRRR